VPALTRNRVVYRDGIPVATLAGGKVQFLVIWTMRRNGRRKKGCCDRPRRRRWQTWLRSVGSKLWFTGFRHVLGRRSPRVVLAEPLRSASSGKIIGGKGVIIGACNVALMVQSKMLSGNAGVSADAAAGEWAANIIPRVTCESQGW
jgi:hypothetical protein